VNNRDVSGGGKITGPLVEIIAEIVGLRSLEFPELGFDANCGTCGKNRNEMSYKGTVCNKVVPS
jgi:hypothetical protein